MFNLSSPVLPISFTTTILPRNIRDGWHPRFHDCHRKIIRKYGYFGRDKVLKLVRENKDLADNLSVAAHLIHGSSDDRFHITYAAGQMSQKEIESVGFGYMPLEQALARYDVHTLKNGFNRVDGEEIFFVSNPAIGLWADKERFYASNQC